MQTLRFTIQPRTAFGTPLVGDTLFGQLCWTLRHHLGNDWLVERLRGYKEGHPFMVISDAFPCGFVPLPTAPSRFFDDSDEDRKILKKKRWLSVKKIYADMRSWRRHACDDREAAHAVLHENGILLKNPTLQATTAQPHNTINRATATTGDGMFAPYSQAQLWFHPAMRFDLHAVIDESRISAGDLTVALINIGQAGYGANASVGLGKFVLDGEAEMNPLPSCEDANAYLTLAPCAPQGLKFAAEKSFYQPLTRFGRHGDLAVLSGKPFKRPLLMAKTGAVFTPTDGQSTTSPFIGQGLGDISSSQPEAVAQGYAPVIGIRMETEQ